MTKFADQKKAAASVTPKTQRSPLAGWFGKREESPNENLPAMDVHAGVSRALRLASQIDDLKDEAPLRAPIHGALAAIERALCAIDKIRDVIEQAYDVALTAQESEDEAGRALLAENYDELRLAIGHVAEKASGEVDPLIGKNRRSIDIQLGRKASYTISALRLDHSQKSLSLSPPREAFSTDDEIEMILAELDRALHKADRAAMSYCRDAQFLITRLGVEDCAA